MKIGTDIIQISRVDRLLNKYGETFKERFLLPEEINILTKTESIAGFWAAKEAISKALGCGIGATLSFHDIIISKNNRGAPVFKLTEDAQIRHTIKTSSLSISHDGGFAIAVVALTQ